jgi:hypothetical protein
MRIRLAGFAIVALSALVTASALPATPKPLTQKQYAEKTLKLSMVTYFKKTPQLSGVKIGKVDCVLPKNGVTFHCTVHTSAPKAHENIVFKLAAPLHEVGTVTWTMTSHACTDSGTHKALAC